MIQNLMKSIQRGDKLLTGPAKERLDKMFTKVIVHQDLPLQLCESDTMHDFMLEVSQGKYKEVSAGPVCVVLIELSEEVKYKSTSPHPGKTMPSVFFQWISKSFYIQPTHGEVNDSDGEV